MFTASTSNRKSSQATIYLVEAIATWFLCAGVCFSVFFLSDSWVPSIASFVVVGLLVFSLRFSQQHPAINRTVRWGAAIALVLLALLFMSVLQNEILIIANNVIDGWNLLTDSYLTHFAVTPSTPIGGVVVGIEGAIMVALVASVLMPYRTRAIIALIAVLCCGFNLLSVHPSMAVASTCLLGWAGLWSLYSRKNVLRATPVVTTMVLAFVCMAGSTALLFTYSGIPAVSNVSKSVLAAIDVARYGQDSLPQGNLYEAADMVAADTTDTSVNPNRMTVTFDNADSVTPLYLRGYTGAVYNGHSWEPLTRADYSQDWDGLFRWLETGGFDQTYQAGTFQALDDTESGRVSGKTTVDVENVGAYRKYTYTPYGTQSLVAGDAQTLLDRYLAGRGISGLSHYQAGVLTNLPNAELYTSPEWVKLVDGTQDTAESTFIKAERVYKTFVEQKYLTVGDAHADFIEETFYGDDWDVAEDDNLFTLTTRIRSVLESRCSVTDNPESLPANTDFVRWFMNTTKEGNSASFASAAVLAFRQAGIPARYVEGYLLSQQDAQAMANAGQTEAQLTGHDSHAWVEIYLDGIGWMPVEVTPGFYQANYATDQVIDIPREVAGDGSDDAATGSVKGDTGDRESKDDKPFDVLGLLLCLLLGLIGLALIVALLAFLQRVVRLAVHRSCIKRAFRQAPASNDFVRWLYARFQKLLLQAGVVVNPNRPLDCVAFISKVAPGIDSHEVGRAFSRFQRCLFGGAEMSAADVRFICSLCSRLQQYNLSRLSPLHRVVRYLVDVYGRDEEYALDIMQR